jgi:hypothetical protein
MSLTVLRTDGAGRPAVDRFRRHTFLGRLSFEAGGQIVGPIFLRERSEKRLRRQADRYLAKWRERHGEVGQAELEIIPEGIGRRAARPVLD